MYSHASTLSSIAKRQASLGAAMRCPPFADESRFIRPLVDTVVGPEEALPARGASGALLSARLPAVTGAGALDVAALRGAPLGSTTELLRRSVSVTTR